MHISPITNQENNSTGVKQRKSFANRVSFKNYYPNLARGIEQKLKSSRGIICDFQGNEFVGESITKVIELFEKLFGKSSLPGKIEMFEMPRRQLAAYYYFDNSVGINSCYNDDCYDNMSKLKESAKRNHSNKYLPNWHSSDHPAHTFIHEFSHCAHWHHLKDRNGLYGAEKVWEGLRGVTVPTSIGRLITRFKISDYAVERKDMCEFIAERASKDICNGITNDSWQKYKDIDVGYSNIFNRKWNYRYSSPQSYIDYFTQQVWNGDIDEAQKTGEKVEEYLAELDAKKTPSVVGVTSAILRTSPTFGWIGDLISDIGEKITNNLDNKNKIKLNH